MSVSSTFARKLMIFCVFFFMVGIGLFSIIQQSSYPKGITSIDVVSENPLNIIVCTSKGELFQNQNNGTEWKDITQFFPKGLTVLSITHVDSIDAIDNIITPYKDETIVKREKEKNGLLIALTMCRGLFLSTNLGRYWSKMPANGLPENVSITDVAVNGKGRIFIGTERKGIYKFEHSKWTSITSTSQLLFMVKKLIIPNHDRMNLYAIVPYGIYLLIEDGKWEPIIFFEKPIVNTMAINSQKPEIMFIGTSEGIIAYNIEKKNITGIFCPDRNITEIACEYYPELLIGTVDGLTIAYDDHQIIENSFIVPGSISGSEVFVIKSLNSSPREIFVGTSNGFFRINEREMSIEIINLRSNHRDRMEWFVGLSIILILVTSILIGYTLLYRRQKRSMIGKMIVSHSVNHGIVPDQIQDAFDSLKRPETADDLLGKKYESIYVDFENSLESLLQPRNDYISGTQGSGKTLLMCRAFTECRHSWGKKYFKNPDRILSEENVIGFYINMQTFVSEIFQLEVEFNKTENEFLNHLVFNMLKQINVYPTSLQKQMRKLFARKNNTLFVDDFLHKFGSFLKAQKISRAFFFLDNFSIIPSHLQDSLSRLFRILMIANQNLYLKIAVIPGKFSFGEIELQRDLIEFPLNFENDSTTTSSDSSIRKRKLKTLVTIIERRLAVFTGGQSHFDDIFDGNSLDIIEAISKISGGNPSSIGNILSQSWEQAVASGKPKMNIDDIYIKTNIIREKTGGSN